MNIRQLTTALLTIVLLALATTTTHAEDKPAAKESKITLAGGKLVLTVPATWKEKKPASNILEYEFEAPAPNDETRAGRVTLMGAGGSVDANIERWKKQFVKADQAAMKTEEKKIAGQTVHLVDFSGDYNDARGPFVPGVVRDDYRMLAAIIVTEKLGQYFIKAYGPAATMATHEKAFQSMVNSLEVK